MKDYINSVKEEMNWGSFSRYRSFIMGVAAVFIVIFHSSDFMSHEGIYFAFINLLNIGVEIFLFVSGIGLYFAYEKKPRFKDYYIKRILNVYLIYFICAVPYSICRNLIISNNGIAAFLKGCTGFSFVLGDDHRCWYVVFIMVLYLVYPLIYKSLKFLQKKKLDLPVTLLVCMCWIALSFYLNYKSVKFYETYEIALTRVPIFLIGCYCGKLVFEKKKFTALEAIIAFGCMGIWLIYRIFLNDAFNSYLSSVGADSLINDRYSKLILSIGTVFFILFFACLVRIKAIHKIFNYFGKISFELYLIHVMIYNCLLDLGKTEFIYYIGNVVISLILSIFLSKLRRLIISKYTARIKSKATTENQIVQ